MTGLPTALNVHHLLAEQDFVRRLARSLVFEQQHVDDLVQEAWLAAAKHPPRAVASTRGWFASVLENLARRRARDDSRRTARERRAAVPEALPAVDAVLAREELRGRVVAAVVALPEPYRGVVLARYFDAKEPSEIARERQVPAGTIRSQLKRALDLLRKKLDAEHGDDRKRWCLALAPLARPEPATGLLAWFSVAGGVWLVVKLVGVGLVLVLAVLGILSLAGDGDAASSAAMSAKRDAERAPEPQGGDAGASLPPPVRAPVTSTPSERAAPAAPARANAGFRGRVVRENGAPAGGELVRFSGLHGISMLADAGREGQRGLELLQAEVRTAPDGKFAIEGLVPNALYAATLGADGKDRTLRLVPVAAGPDEVVDLGDLALVAKAAVSGRVVDREGAPVPDAEVLCLDLPAALGSLLPFERLVPKHGGFLTLPVPGAKELSDREAHARNLRSYLGSDLFVEAGIEKRKSMATFVVARMPWLEELWNVLPIARTHTGADGQFRLEGAQPGSCWLVARKPGLVPGGKPRIVLRAGETRELGDLVLGTGEEFSGRVLSATGQPLAHAEVRIAAVPALGYRGAAFAEAPCTCDAGGKFCVRGLSSEKALLAARRSASDPWHVVGPIDVQPDLELRLPATSTLALSVSDAEGQPVAAPELQLFVGPWLGELRRIGVQQELPLAARLRPGAGGTLEIVDLSPGTYQLRVSARGSVPAEITVQVPSSEPVAVRLEKCAPLRIIVRSADGKPLCGARVYLQQDGDAGPDRAILPTDYGLPRWPVLPHLAGATDAQGVLETSERPTASVAVHVLHPSFGSASASVAEGQREATITLELPGTITGRLFDHGKPADPKRWALTLERDGFSGAPEVPFDRRRIALAADGSFEVKRLVPGKYVLSCTACKDEAISLHGLVETIKGVVFFDDFGGSAARREVELGAGASVAVSLDTDPNAPEIGAVPASLRGVYTLDGVPQRGARVLRILRAFETAALTEVAGDGGFAAPLPGGRQSIRIEAADQADTCTWEGTLELESGTERFLDLRLETASLSGTAAFAVDLRVEGHTVVANGTIGGGKLRRQAKIDAAGKFEFGHLPLGEYSLRALGADGKSQTVRAKVGPGQNLVGERLLLQELLVFRGRVEGLETPGKFCFLMIGTTKSSIGTGVNDGRFAINDLEPAVYTISLSRAGRQIEVEPKTVDLTRGSVREFVLRVK